MLGGWGSTATGHCQIQARPGFYFLLLGEEEFSGNPMLVQTAQIDRRAEQQPLGFDFLKSAHCPSPKIHPLLAPGEYRLDGGVVQ